jgi:8-oxo-dGTP pyrophosphatase MutT (NUDIX family)
MSGIKKGSLIIIYYIDNDKKMYILSGNESHYLSDKDPFITRELQSKNKIASDSEKQKSKSILDNTMSPDQIDFACAKVYFCNLANSYSKKKGIRIQFDTPKIDDNKYSVNLRSQGDKWGFPKGGTEEIDMEGITDEQNISLQTILRECREELGIQLPTTVIKEGKWVYNQWFYETNQKVSRNDTEYSVFVHEIKDANGFTKVENIQSFQKCIQRRKNAFYGEMFDLEFRSFNDLVEISSQFNFLSRQAFNIFVQHFKIEINKNQKAVTEQSIKAIIESIREEASPPPSPPSSPPPSSPPSSPPPSSPPPPSPPRGGASKRYHKLKSKTKTKRNR